MPALIDDGDTSLGDLAGMLANPEPAEGEAPETGAPNTPATDSEGDDGEDGTKAPDGAETDDGEPEADGEDGEDADDPEEPNTDPVYTVKVDGKDVQVNLKEALAGYQRQADYTRKTQEVAEARKALDNELTGARGQREQYAAVLKLIQDKLGPADQDPTAEQWNALRAADPNRYATEWTDYARRVEQRKAVTVEQERIAGEQRAENTNKFRTFLDGERTKLHAALPILADKEKGAIEMKALREYASKTFGWTDPEMDQAYDHRMILAIDKARKWDAHNAALAAAKAKVKQAPQLPAPGSRQPQKSGKTPAREAQQKKFDRSGDIDDAVSLLLA